MGYRSDLGTATVGSVDPRTGYPIGEYGHLLDPNFDGYTPWEIGSTLYNFTNPYGHLHFAIGSGDDFVCFDYATLSGARGDWIILDATRNSETGSFIESADYQVLPINTKAEKVDACRAAFDMLDLGFDDVAHDRRGWNQDWRYFGRAVFCSLFNVEVAQHFKPWVTDRMKRFGGKRIEKLIHDTLYGDTK